jgi:protein-S-isoprenylcysteine O-methyltransferase Ste14
MEEFRLDHSEFLSRLLKVKPNILMVLGLIVIIAVGFLGEYFSWGRIPWSPFSNILGSLIILVGWLFHLYCHKFHHHAHERSEQIRNIVSTGPFAKIRHPMYLSLILMDGGLVIAWGIAWMFLPFLLFLGWTCLIIIQEEKYLLQTLGVQYEEYVRQVPWRLVPKIF